MAGSATPNSVVAVTLPGTQAQARYSFTLKGADSMTLASGVGITGTLTAGGKSVGTVSPTTTLPGGVANVTITPDADSPTGAAALTLTLTPDGRATDAAVITVENYTLGAFSLTPEPVQLPSDGGALNFVATATNYRDGNKFIFPASLSVQFGSGPDNDADAMACFFPGSALPATVAGADGKSITLTSTTAPATFVQANNAYRPLQIVAELTASTAGAGQTTPPKATAQAVITELLPPQVQLPGAPTLLGQDIFDGGIIPWRIPRVGTAAVGDMLVLNATSKRSGGTVMLGSPVFVQAKDITHPHTVQTQSTDAIYQTFSDSLEVIYSDVPVDGDRDHAFVSRPQTVIISRTKLDHGNTADQTLKPPQPDIYTYTYTDQRAGTPLNTTIRFHGDYLPIANDRITVHLDLTGYTVANAGKFTKLSLAPYVLSTADAEQGHDLVLTFAGNPAAILDSFTATKLAGIEASNGNLYYTVENMQAGLNAYGAPRTSPIMPIIVDTVPPYSGNAMALTPFLDKLKLDSVRRHRD